MKDVKRDENLLVIIPEGMIYIKEHPSVNKKGLLPKEVMVCEHYRNRKRKKVPRGSLWQRIKARYDKWQLDRAIRGFCGK